MTISVICQDTLMLEYGNAFESASTQQPVKDRLDQGHCTLSTLIISPREGCENIQGKDVAFLRKPHASLSFPLSNVIAVYRHWPLTSQMGLTSNNMEPCMRHVDHGGRTVHRQTV